MDLMERFLTFAEQSPTAFHAAAHLAEMLRDSGYEELKETPRICRARPCSWPPTPATL